MKWWRIRVPLHETWHLTMLCAGIVTGLALSRLEWSVYFASWVWLLVGLAIFLLACWKRFVWLAVLVFIAGGLMGLWRGSNDLVDRASYQSLYRKEVTIAGVISEDIDTGRRGEMIVRLGQVSVEGYALPGKVWVTIDSGAAIRRSDHLVLRGELREGFGSFAASMYRAELVSAKRPIPGDVALDVRQSFGERVRESVDDPSASLGMGYLTGERRSLPDDLDSALRVAGLTHIVVASGYNLTILVRFTKRWLEKRSRFATVFVSSLLIVAFIAITGMSPSMSRAGLVAGLALAAWYFGRKFHPVTLVSFAAAVTGLIEPSFVWGNLGWQLSFAAFVGVMILAPLLQAYFFGSKKPGWLRQILGETISAQIMTAPLLLYSFGYVSNVAVVANALVLPLVPLAMLLTFLTGLTGYVSGLFTELMAIPTQALLDYMVWVAMQTAGLQWALTEFSLPLWGVGVYFGAVAAGCWWMWRATGYRLRDSNIIE